jgi:hypothetical protein
VTNTRSSPSACKEGFFTVDRRTWSAICDLDDINVAIAYLVLGNGTGRQNSVTRWSAQAMKNWIDMPWRDGKAAILKLIEEGFVLREPDGSRTRPIYRLPSWEAAQDFDGDSSAGASRPKTELIWLPNSLVTGTDSGEMPPLTKLRLSGDIWALRLLIDLYYAHHLESDSGVLTKYLREDYERLRVGEQGPYTLWGFRSAGKGGCWDGPLADHKARRFEEGEDHPAWSSVLLLEEMGLMSFMPHLYPNADPRQEPLHSLGELLAGAEPEEEELRVAANAAAVAMLQLGQIDSAYLAGGYDLLLPALSWMKDVQVRGVVRLRYRPHTSATAKWLKALTKGAPGWVARYQDLRARALAARPAQIHWRAWNA